MPIARFQLDDGRIARFEVPDGTTPEQAQQMMASHFSSPAQELQRKREANYQADAEKYSPTVGMSGTDKFLAGLGKSFADTGRGLGQLVGLVSKDDVAESRKRDADLMKFGSATAGNIVGSLATSAPLLAIPGAATIPGAAAIGAISGFAQPVAEDGERSKNTLIGAGASAVVPAAITTGKIAKSFLEPFYQGGRDNIVGRALRTAAGNQADTAAANLANAGTTVQGSMPTVGQAANNAGIAALERTATAIDPVVMNDFAARQLANNQARIAALQNIIGDKQASIAARKSATEALYAAANGEQITITPELEKLLSRPVMKSAVNDARNLAANNGEHFSLTSGTPAQPSSILGPNGAPAYVVPGTPAGMLGRDAHTIKMSLDDAIEGLAGQQGLARNAKRAAGNTQEQFLSEIEKQVPAYGQARETFRKLSAPVNQSEVADLILQRSAGNIQGNMTPAAFNRALNDKTAQSALGRKGATIEGTFTPEQMGVLNGIKQDLQSLDFARTAGRGVGSDTVQKLAFTNMLDQAGVPQMLRNFGPAGIVGNIAQRGGQIAYSDANKKLAEQLGIVMLDPKEAARLMQKTAKNRGLLSLEAPVRKGGAYVGSVAPAGLLAVNGL